jgi:hypothetical protein
MLPTAVTSGRIARRFGANGTRIHAFAANLITAAVVVTAFGPLS